jgi:5-methylcytosine-specific restriction endonuclease McrA
MADANSLQSTLSSSVLVVNRSYAAVRVVTVRRAFVMLYRDAAEVIHIENGMYVNYDFRSWCELSWFWYEELFGSAHFDSDEWVRVVHFGIRAPRVIRLLRFDHAPRQAVRFNRKNLFARDNNRCQYCGDAFPASQLSFDHVTPRSRGGNTTWENVVTCCLSCNSRKGNRTPQEAGMKLHSTPSTPKENPLLNLKLGNPRYHIWQPFLGQNSHAVEIA